jgi:hypothetical protein
MANAGPGGLLRRSTSISDALSLLTPAS